MDDLLLVPVRSLVPLIATALLTLAACGGGSDDPVGRAYELRLRTDDSSEEYAYIAVDEPAIQVGDEVTFVMENTGSLAHDLQVVAPDGNAIGVAAAVAPGEELTLTVLFEEAGFYRLNCLVDNHLTEHDMQAIVEVTEA